MKWKKSDGWLETLGEFNNFSCVRLWEVTHIFLSLPRVFLAMVYSSKLEFGVFFCGQCSSRVLAIFSCVLSIHFVDYMYVVWILCLHSLFILFTHSFTILRNQFPLLACGFLHFACLLLSTHNSTVKQYWDRSGFTS